MNSSELNQLLELHSSKEHCIEYGTYLSNHISHGIIALYRLGADRTRVDKFVKWYIERLEKPEQQPDQLSLPDTHAGKVPDIPSLLGKRVAYFPILEYYKSLLQDECKGELGVFIAKYLPRMISGMFGAATHPVIHMGYGYSVGNSTLVAEGMAYLHHSHLPLQFTTHKTDFPFGSGHTDIEDVVNSLREDTALYDFMISKSTESGYLPWDTSTGMLTKRGAALLTYKADIIASYVSQIKLPSWFIPADSNIPSVIKLMDWVIEKAVVIYTASERRNDFFLLHGVTSAWSVQQLCSSFQENQVNDAIVCIKLYLCVLFTVYMAQDRPALNPAYLTPSNTDISWQEIISKVVDSQVDEHYYKLVQVCFEKSKDLDCQKQVLYKAAAMSHWGKSFVF